MFRLRTGLPAAGAGLAAVAFLSGCSLGPNKELRALAEASLPAQHESIDCSWGSTSGFEDQPSANYGCSYFVKGARDEVIGSIRSRLAAAGFAVSKPWR